MTDSSVFYNLEDEFFRRATAYYSMDLCLLQNLWSSSHYHPVQKIKFLHQDCFTKVRNKYYLSLIMHCKILNLLQCVQVYVDQHYDPHHYYMVIPANPHIQHDPHHHFHIRHQLQNLQQFQVL